MSAAPPPDSEPSDGSPSHSPPSLQARGLEHGLALAWSSLLAVILTWPMVLSPGAAALGHPGADGLKHLWTLWWMRASVWREGRFPFDTTLVNAPVGMELYPIEPLSGLIAVLTPGVELVLLSNLLVLAHLVLTGVAGAWFGRVVSGRRTGGLMAATVLEGSAVMAFSVHVGVGELQPLWWLPLGLGSLVMARRTGRWPWFLLLAGVLAATVITGFYLGLFLAIAVATWALCTLGPLDGLPARLLRYAVAAGLALAVVLPLTRAFATTYHLHDEPEGSTFSYVFGAQDQPVADPPSARLDPRELLLRADPPETAEQLAYGGGRYLGLVTVGLALVGLVRRPREGLPWLVVATVGAVLAMGSYLTMGGQPVATDGRGWLLPFCWLNRFLAVVAEPINFPVRMLAITTTALAALAASAVRGWGLLLAPLVVIDIATGQRVPRPWPTLELEALPGLEALADQYDDDAVLDLALMARPDAGSRRLSIAAQLLHQHPVNTMPIERVEFFARDGVVAVQVLPLYESWRDAMNEQVVQVDEDDARQTLALLAELDLRLILVHDGGSRGELADPLVSLMDQLCGPAILAAGTARVWRVPPVQATEAELQAWRKEHARRVQDARRGGFQAGAPLR